MFGDNAANDYNWQFFENNAIPRYAVTITGGKVDEKVKNNILRFFNEQIHGQNHRTIVLPVPRNMVAEFKALDATPNEGSFLNYKKLNREEIAAVHRVPPSEIGLWEDANKANSSQQSKNFFLKVIKPYQSQDEAMMNRILQYGLGIDDIKFAFKNVEYTDDQERATVILTRANAHKMYVDSLVNAINALNSAGGGGKSGGMGGGGGWGNSGKSTTGTGSSGDGGSTAPAPLPDPVLPKGEAAELIRILMERIKNATDTFGIEEPVSGSDV
jgi:hypothetical protein